jgi:hypothetical protein
MRYAATIPGIAVTPVWTTGEETVARAWAVEPAGEGAEHQGMAGCADQGTTDQPEQRHAARHQVRAVHR